jgi:hypothetical protein
MATLQEVGLRVIVFIDDILVMAETESLLKDNITEVVYLLENLGVVVNHPKSELTPTQEIEFLGFTVNPRWSSDYQGKRSRRSEPRQAKSCNHSRYQL